MGRTEADETAKMEQMRHWLDALCTELQLDPAVVQEPETPLLKLISTVAHGPSRPGAPMTAFVVGYAAASTGRPTAEIIAQVQRLAEGWEQ